MTRPPDLLRDPCSAGFYCPAKTPYPIPCPGGTYSPSTGRFALSDCLITPKVFSIPYYYFVIVFCILYFVFFFFKRLFLTYILFHSCLSSIYYFYSSPHSYSVHYYFRVSSDLPQQCGSLTYYASCSRVWTPWCSQTARER